MLLPIFLAAIPDHRRPQGRRYGLEHLLLFSILAILSDATSYRKIQRYPAGGFEIIAGRSGSGSLASLTTQRLSELRTDLLALAPKYGVKVPGDPGLFNASQLMHSTDFSDHRMH